MNIYNFELKQRILTNKYTNFSIEAKTYEEAKQAAINCVTQAWPDIIEGDVFYEDDDDVLPYAYQVLDAEGYSMIENDNHTITEELVHHGDVTHTPYERLWNNTPIDILRNTKIDTILK